MRTGWTSDCLSCTTAYTRERIGRCRRGGFQYPSLTAGRDRSALPPWRTRSVQKAVVDVILTPLYEPDFLGFSYGFRPGRGAHDALDALAFGIERRKVNWIIDADIRAFFDRLSRDHLLRFLEERLDTSSAAGELVFHVFGAIAHFERRLISERTRDGIAAARKRGRTPGRPPLDPDTVSAAQKLIEAGLSPARTAKQLGIGRATAYRIAKAER